MQSLRRLQEPAASTLGLFRSAQPLCSLMNSSALAASAWQGQQLAAFAATAGRLVCVEAVSATVDCA